MTQGGSPSVALRAQAGGFDELGLTRASLALSFAKHHRRLYLWRRIRGLRLDPSAYSSLRGGEEGEAMN